MWRLPINVEGERKHLLPKSRKWSKIKIIKIKNKNLEDVTAEQLQAEARCIVQHPALEETGEG